MGWGIGFVGGRDVGYEVPAICESPKCSEEIDRGIGCVCGGDVGGGDYGCGLFFCAEHLYYGRKPRGAEHTPPLCLSCQNYRDPYPEKPDIEEWQHWKLVHPSWAEWREMHPEEVKDLEATVSAAPAGHTHDWPEEDMGGYEG